MNRLLFLPIVSAAVLIAATCSRSAAQGSAGNSVAPGKVARRTHSSAPPAAAQTSEQALGITPDSTSESHRKSWKDLAHAKTDGKTDRPPVTFSPWSAAGALAVVVGLILVLARLFRRHAPLFQQSLPQEALEILGRRFVDPRQTILLVRIGARILVLGSSANGLNPLGQIDDPVEVDVLAGLCRRGPQSGALGTSFLKLLKGESGTRANPQTDRSSPSARQSPALRPYAEPPSTSQSLETSQEGLSQPEYDLVRRLRGTSAPVRATGTEGA
jgi:flagellar biogenesis protein FliO